MADISQRSLPHHVDVELSILGVLLDGRETTAARIVRTHLSHPLFFWSRTHRMVYLAILELDDRGQHCDYIPISEYLARYPMEDAIDRIRECEAAAEATVDGSIDRKRILAILRRPRQDADPAAAVLDSIGGFGALAKIMDAHGSVSALEANAKILADLYCKRRFIQCMSRLVDDAYSTRDSFSDLLAATSKTVMGLTKLNTRTATVMMGDLAKSIPGDLRDRIDNPVEGVTTGFPKIDDMLVCLAPGYLYVVAARPGVGKTSWALNVASHVTSNPDSPGRVLFFALEMSPRDLAAKVVTSIAKVDYSKYRSAKVSPDEFQRIEIAATDTSYAIEMPEDMDMDVHTARGIARRCAWDDSQPPIKLIVVDYLQLFRGSSPGQDDFARISEVSRVLKMMALELKVPVLALSQMSRDIEKGTKSREPRLSDLRGSGSIEQDANVVIFLHRDESVVSPTGGQLLKIIVAKNREGRSGHGLYNFNGATMTYEQQAEPDEEGDAPLRAERGSRLTQLPTTDEDLFNGSVETPVSP